MKRGYLKTYMKTFFIILVIAAIVAGIILYLKKEYDVEQVETIKTNMLLIKGKTKIVTEKVKIKEKDAKYIGTKIEKEINDEKIKQLQESGVINTNEKNYQYYILEQKHLDELGLSNIALKEGFYIVEYTNNEIIYSEGVELEVGKKLYKLSEIQEAQSKEENNELENKKEEKNTQEQN